MKKFTAIFIITFYISDCKCYNKVDGGKIMPQDKKEMSRGRKLLRLFLSTLYISSFTFGGGFVIVTFMKKKFVDELHWIDEQEMLDDLGFWDD